LSPSETITKVGEGLFNLPGMFEVYADDNALGFSLETLPDLDAETIRMLRTEYGQVPLLPGAAGIVASPIPSPGLSHAPPAHVNKHGHAPRMSLAGGSGGNEFLPAGSGSTSAVSPAGAPRVSPSLSHHHSYSLSHHPASSAAAHAHAGPQMQAQDLPAEVVISTWLSSLTRSVLLYLVQKAVPAIRSLTKHGQEQLAADLGYISNVAKALDVEVEQLEKWRAALEAETEGAPRKKLSVAVVGGTQSDGEPRSEDDGAVQEVDPEIAEMLQRIRSRPPSQTSAPR
jgi:transposase-like protein